MKYLKLLKHVGIAETRRLRKSFNRARNEIYLTHKRSLWVRILGLVVGSPIAAVIAAILLVTFLMDRATSILEVVSKTIFKYTRAVLKKTRLKRKNRENKK